ncbi:MAG TPA: fumarylacetoacetate hydrolase family protein [Trueperaceae bacterium]|nr:fumarylacetoacetate hydrolase family protein [Trueperaceae bacterium]
MRTVTYHDQDGVARIGVVTRQGVLDVAAAVTRSGRSLDSSAETVFAEGQAAFDRLRDLAEGADGPFFPTGETLKLAPTTPSPGKILCIGLNYRKHAAESGMPVPTAPVLFSKFNNSLAAHGATVDIAGLEQVDYEAELGVVIGTGGKNIAEERALEHVLGYLNANDVSERVLQMGSGQWLLGKTLDGFLPLGPELVTSDEAGDPTSMRVRGWLNGELRQDSNTSDMVFSVPEIIAFASRYMTLAPGDVIVTGTPEGVVLGRSQKDWVVAGDVYEVEVGVLGRLRTVFG